METRYAALVHARLGRGQRRPHLGAQRAPPSADVAANTNRRRPHRSRIATNMANVAFILADLYPDSEFIKPWQRARDAGYQTTVVGLRHGVDLERNVGADWVAGGGRGRNLITSRTPADLRPFAMHYWSSSCGAQRPATRGRRRRRTQRRTVQPQRRQCNRVITARAAAPS